MKKIHQRAGAVLVLVGLLLFGVGAFLHSYMTRGADWVAFPVNRHVYTNGVLSCGTILDCNGAVLSEVRDGARMFSESKAVRRAVLHTVGDAEGNIGTGALSKFRSLLMGYSPLTGVTSPNRSGNTLYLTLDADLCAQAYRALDGRDGTVLVYNYKTGAVLCMVSAPGFDPYSPPDITGQEEKYEGIYLNKALSSTFVPGSIFKLVTTAAAIENIPNLSELKFTCEGATTVNGDKITCEGVHGEIGIDDALAVSCNVYFAELSQLIGGDTLSKYAEKFGLTASIDVNGIKTARGRFDVAPAGTANLSWSGIGQYDDLVNPCSMLAFMGAIANDGMSVAPRILQKAVSPLGLPIGVWFPDAERLLKSETASALSDMMRYNVTSFYGENKFPGLELCAKTGTAQIGEGKKPHAWFVGFLRDEEFPYAFVVLVENGGSGRTVAGSVANTVLQAAVS